MKMKLCLSIIFFIINNFTVGQNIKVSISNQNDSLVTIYTIKGDKQIILDTIRVINNQIDYNVTSEYNSNIFRLILGQTTIARLMNEPPQYLDFIYNGEEVEIETNFYSPFVSATVIKSKENMVWFEFLRKEKQYQKQVKELVMQINYFQKNDDAYYTSAKQAYIINKYNNLQKERNKLITSIEKDYPNLYLGQLIKIKQEPFLDGNLPEQERKEILKKHYFDNVNFTDESLLNSSVYTDKVFSYFMLYAQKGLLKEKQEEEFKKAIEVILDKTSKSHNVSAFIVDYLMRGFERLGLDNLQAYISENYMVPNGCSDDKNTLKRRLAFQQLRMGNRVPNFNLKDTEGGDVDLFQTESNYKLVLYWETTCPMCKELLPHLRDWYCNKDIDLEVFAISIDEDKSAWQNYVVKSDYPWINLNENKKWEGKVATAYNLYATPTMFLLDNENRILAKPISFSDFLEAVSIL